MRPSPASCSSIVSSIICATHSIEPGAKRACVEAELGDDDAVHLDHGDPLQHPAEQQVVALDVDLQQLEAVALAVQGDDPVERLLAEMTARPRIHGHHPQAAALELGKAS